MNDTQGKILQICILTILTSCFSLFAGLLSQNLATLEAQNALMISENVRLTTEIAKFNEQISLATVQNIFPVVSGPVLWGPVVVKVVCASCIFVSLIGIPAFFAGAPYTFCYSSSDWYCGILASCFPLAWLKDVPAIVWADSLGNFYKIFFDTTTDTFTMTVKTFGSMDYFSIATFLQTLFN